MSRKIGSRELKGLLRLRQHQSPSPKVILLATEKKPAVHGKAKKQAKPKKQAKLEISDSEESDKGAQDGSDSGDEDELDDGGEGYQAGGDEDGTDNDADELEVGTVSQSFFFLLWML